MKAADVIKAWNEADPTELHPTRTVSEADYWHSGETQANQLAAVLEPDSTVLDFGCGDGRVAIPLHKLGFNVIGADSSATMLNRFSKFAPNMLRIQTDGTNLTEALTQLGTPQVDAAYSLAVLIHHDYETAATLITQLTAVVKPGGLLILDWPASNTPSERDHYCGITTWPPQAQRKLMNTLSLQEEPNDLPWLTLRTSNRALPVIISKTLRNTNPQQLCP